MTRDTKALLKLVGLTEPEYTVDQLALIFKRSPKTILNMVSYHRYPRRLERFRGRYRMLIPAKTVRLLAKRLGFPGT